MALESLITPITLDVYDHDTTPTTIKTISADDNSRYVRASLTYQGEIYSISSTSKVTLTIIRPDKTAVSIDGETFSYGDEDTTSYGVGAELDIVATIVKGTLLAQFKIEDGDQVLRTEVFKINNGVALDIDSDKWAGTYQGYDLSEFDKQLAAMRTATSDDVGKALLAKRVANGEVTEWEFGEVSGTPVRIDDTLTVSGAAADSKTVGDRLNTIFTEKATDNLFDKNSAITGSYIGTYSGDIIEYTGVFHAFIEFEAGSYTFLAQPGVFGNQAYAVPILDENQNFVSYAEGTHTEIDSTNSIVTVTFSSQATSTGKYFGVNGTSDVLNTLMVVKGTQYPAEYIEHGTYKTIDGLQISKSQIIDLDEDSNPLYGKIISINGDSIAYGVGYQGGYGKIIAEENGMTYENIAVGGGTVAYVGTNVYCISRTITNMRADADYIILDGGGNDADSGVPLGTLSTGYDATLDDTTFAGGFESMLKAAIARFPGKKIGYVFIHKCSWRFDSQVPSSYYDVAKSACEKWGIPYCDLNTQTPPLNYISVLKTAYTANGDGYHPNEQGYRLFYVPKITAWMKTL